MSRSIPKVSRRALLGSTLLLAGGTGGFARYMAIAPPLPTRRRALKRGSDGVLS